MGRPGVGDHLRAVRKSLEQRLGSLVREVRSELGPGQHGAQFVKQADGHHNLQVPLGDCPHDLPGSRHRFDESGNEHAGIDQNAHRSPWLRPELPGPADSVDFLLDLLKDFLVGHVNAPRMVKRPAHQLPAERPPSEGVGVLTHRRRRSGDSLVERPLDVDRCTDIRHASSLAPGPPIGIMQLSVSVTGGALPRPGSLREASGTNGKDARLGRGAVADVGVLPADPLVAGVVGLGEDAVDRVGDLLGALDGEHAFGGVVPRDAHPVVALGPIDRAEALKQAGLQPGRS